jgi:hypothetical protein
MGQLFRVGIVSGANEGEGNLNHQSYRSIESSSIVGSFSILHEISGRLETEIFRYSGAAFQRYLVLTLLIQLPFSAPVMATIPLNKHGCGVVGRQFHASVPWG